MPGGQELTLDKVERFLTKEERTAAKSGSKKKKR
jgi:hypothetical protein